MILNPCPMRPWERGINNITWRKCILDCTRFLDMWCRLFVSSSVGNPLKWYVPIAGLQLMEGETGKSWETRFSIDLDEIFESCPFQWGNVSFGIGPLPSRS